MNSKTAVISAFLGITSAAKPVGIRNAAWPLWGTKITLLANTSSGAANNSSLIGS
jgi:hypothetical protein